MDDPSDWKFGPLRVSSSFLLATVAFPACDFIVLVISWCQSLDELLRCPICFEYFKTTVVLPRCSHNCEFIV